MYELHTDCWERSVLYWDKYKIWEGYVSSDDLKNLFEAIRLPVVVTHDELDEDVKDTDL